VSTDRIDIEEQEHPASVFELAQGDAHTPEASDEA
jgi:hypothetical protein